MNHIKMSPWNEKKQKDCFKNFHFIMKNRKLLHKLPCYDEVNIYEMSKSFGWLQELIKLK